MNKIIAIGDIHGRDKWKDVLENEGDFDKLIFMGDYFDTRDDIPCNEWIDNFNEIVALKRADPDKIVLLIGNHDYHYIRGVTETYSGYTSVMRTDIQEVLDINRDIMQMCFIHDNFIFTHAGITNTWYKNGLVKWFQDKDIDIKDMGLCDQVNYLFEYAPNQFKFTNGRYFDDYGDEVTQTPIWVRPGALMKDRLGDYFYVVGHTFGDPEVLTDHNPGGVIKIDALGLGYYLVIQDGEVEFKRIPRDPKW